MLSSWLHQSRYCKAMAKRLLFFRLFRWLYFPHLALFYSPKGVDINECLLGLSAGTKAKSLNTGKGLTTPNSHLLLADQRPGCSQEQCVNTNGSFYCCPDGYENPFPANSGNTEHLCFGTYIFFCDFETQFWRFEWVFIGNLCFGGCQVKKHQKTLWTCTMCQHKWKLLLLSWWIWEPWSFS